MIDKMVDTTVSIRITKRFVALVLPVVLALLVACSGSSPSNTPAATALPTETAVAVTLVPDATATAPPTPLPATALPPPTVRVDPAPTTARPAATPTAEPPASTAEPFVSAEHRAASERVFALVKELVDELGHREAATPEELRAAEHLKERFDALGYSAELQSFSLEHFDLMGFIQGQRQLATIQVQSPIQLTLPGLPLTTTPSGAEGTGVVVQVPLESGDHAVVEGIKGKVALIQAGEISLADPGIVLKLQNRVNEVAEAGAVAAVVDASAAVGMQGYRPLLAAASPIPALMVPPGPPGATNPMSQAPPGTEIVVSVQIQTVELESNNVVAELKGEGDEIIVVGAHYDVVPQTESGANDNTSGTAIVLSLAEALAGESLPFTVRFILFGAEEIGLYGSSHHVSSLGESELARIRAMVNFDVVATGDFIAVVGDGLLTSLALEVAATLNIDASIGMLPPGASSDHQPFEQSGVPVLVLYAPDVSRMHTPSDTLEHVQPERLGEAFLIAEALLRLTE